MTNAIEHCFSESKAYLKKALHNEQIKNKIPGMCHCGMYLLKEDD